MRVLTFFLLKVRILEKSLNIYDSYHKKVLYDMI